MARRRGDKETIEERVRREFASSGGKARAGSLSEKRRKEIAKAAIRKRWDGSGPRYTYFVCNQERSMIKIGSTVNVRARVRSIHCNPGNRQFCNGKKVLLLAVFKDRGEFSEATLQEKFSRFDADQCHEWFHLSKEILRFLSLNRSRMVSPVPESLDVVLQG